MKKIILLIFGFLLINNFVIAKDFKGAELRTKTAYTYGRFEVRYKSTQKDGVLASFFTYHEGTGNDSWNELDIEIMGRYCNDVQFNSITPGPTHHVRHQNVNFNPSTDFHNYAIEWTPQYVAWFIDGSEVYRQTGSHIATITRSQKIMMNIWNPVYADWAGVWNANVIPAFAYYDFVKYYAYTPGTGNYGTNNNFTYIWSDDFNAFDSNRWAKATHTFDGNNCDFVTENVVYKDGYMILCLTDATNLGYVDKKAPSPMWARYEYNNVYVRFNEDLDPVSATNSANYIMSGVTINSIILLEDNKTVKINVTNFNTAVTNNIILMNIKDVAEPANNMSAKALTIANSSPLTFPAKINIGGNSVLGYLADVEFKYNTEYGYSEGTAASTSSGIQIAGTDEDEIYRAERYYLTKYDVRVPNGKYNLKLMFCENFFTTAGSRIFDVYVQNELAKNNLDIYQEVGFRTAYNFDITNIEVKDGLLKIHLCAEISETLLNGIIIEQISTGVNEESNTNLNYGFNLLQNYPNPFNGTTKIPIKVNKSSNIQLKIFNILGEEKFSRLYSNLSNGTYELVWNGTDNSGAALCSGLYIYEVSDAFIADCKKMIYLK
ncbi:MAG: family 16 glycosylhydrolase [bacterium]